MCMVEAASHSGGGGGADTPPPGMCTCAWLGNSCPLLPNGDWRRGKDNCDKHGRHWLTLVEKWDTPTARGILGEDFQTECAQKPPLILALHPRLGRAGGSACGTGRCWAHLRLRPGMVGSQLTESCARVCIARRQRLGGYDPAQHNTRALGCFPFLTLRAACRGWEPNVEV